MSEAGAGAATSGGEHEGAAAYAEHQRRLRRPAGAHTHPTVREEAVEGRHAEAGDRLHKLSQRARQGGQG